MLLALRHLTASILANAGEPAKNIQSILRHKRLATTERYLHQQADLKPALRILSSKRKSRLAEPSPPAKRLTTMEVVK